MLELAPDISNFIIVPKAGNQSFGSLFEISSESDEIFISGAKVSDIEIIDAVTAPQIKAHWHSDNKFYVYVIFIKWHTCF